MPWHQDHDKSSKNTENLIKPWERRRSRELHLTVDCPRTYNRFERLVCNQEVDGSIPFVSTNFLSDRHLCHRSNSFKPPRSTQCVIPTTKQRNSQCQSELRLATIVYSISLSSTPSTGNRRLPIFAVFTIADMNKFRTNSSYVERKVAALHDYLLRIDDVRGTGRLYLP